MLRRISVRQPTQHNLICLTEGASFLQRAAEQLIQPERGIAFLSSLNCSIILRAARPRPVNSSVRCFVRYGEEQVTNMRVNIENTYEYCSYCRSKMKIAKVHIKRPVPPG